MDSNRSTTQAVAANQDANVARRERLRRLALETVDLVANPNILVQQLVGFECRLCASWHANEAQYMAHTRDAGHQYNLLARTSADRMLPPGRPPMRRPTTYTMTTRRDPDTQANIAHIQVFCPWSQGDFECKVDSDGDKQYLRAHCTGHEVVDIDLSHHGVIVSRVASWDELSKTLTIDVTFGTL
ncbi:hypothetical protein SDRG_11091 [Saprolegnia diclina VS20]|uniref:C2H2-type domain-containing protein n=1 Tax=Saprolegnia diclina (strain VS20) TaxID=1156394 RepID=T0Q001_SAPDV|nr:hypothetical protein SDRG_11091 [Saprolegnia diclina VS20]EQC31164.1 hypothetical protein SDRG_11091 [Saprolegnia diclina VS20]|eukprot:XP_008615337.1 hypothetical protein SDRG_11091 [Saprolegnia diclina VS20]